MTFRLTHLHLHARDLDRSVEFYRGRLGFRLTADFGGVLFLTDGSGFDLALSRERTPGRLPAWFHFGFRLRSARDVRAAFRRMKRAKVNILESVSDRGGYTRFCIADPDGTPIEVYYDATLAEASARRRSRPTP